MKKLLFILLAVAAMSSCAKNDELNSDNGAKKTHLTLVGNTYEDTRTSIGELTDSKYPVLWCSGDALGLFSTTEGADVRNIEATIMEESDGKRSGTFIVNDEMKLASGSTNLLIYYPYNTAAVFESGTTKISNTLSTEQHQSAPGNSRHVGKYGFAYASTTAVDDVTPVKFTLTHALAYVKFDISTTELADYKLKSVSLFAKATQTPLSGNYTIDLSSGEETVTSGKSYATVTVDSPELLTAKQTLWLTTLPADLTDKDVYVVVTLINDAQTTVTIPILRMGKVLKSNAVNTITVNNLKLSDNACNWFEPIETRLLVGGWAYGNSNCILTEASVDGTNTTFDVKARGNFMEVAEPKYAQTIFHCDLDNAKDMVRVNGSGVEMSALTSDYKVTVNTFTSTYVGGCGAIAIYGGDMKTPLWSFTVWMTPKPAEQIYKNGTVLDRNIGAYSVEDNWKSNGVYFQWGRPMPFGWGAKGYESIPTQATDIRFSIENPRKLLYTAGVENTKSDWYLGAWTGARSDRKDDLWGNPNNDGDLFNKESGHKSIYDPCPKGYRIVSPAILKEVEDNATLDLRTNVYALKYLYDGAAFSYWPLGGCRWGSNAADRASNNSKTSACYWSNSPSTTYANDKDQGGLCLFYQYSGQTYTYTAGRSHAFLVRCMADTEKR